MAKKQNKRIPLVGGFYEEASKNLNAQKTVNWYPVGTLDGKTNVSLFPTPGWTELMYDGGNTHYSMERPLVFSPVLDKFVVIGDYKTGPATHIGALKTFAPDETNLSNITFYTNFVGSLNPGGRPMYAGIIAGASAFHQDITTTESMVLAVTGDSNTARTNCIFALDISNTSAIKSNVVYWEDPIVPTSIAYMKGYVVINHDNAGTTNNDPFRGRFYSNSVSTTDLGNVVIYDYDWSKMAYNAGEYVKAVVVNGQYLYVFGETHYEVWYFAGDTAFPWDVIQEATGRIGLPDKNCYASYQDMIFIVGKSENGNYGAYVIKGLENKKISTPVIDRRWQQQTIAGNTDFPRVMVQEFNGQVFIHFNVDSLGYTYNLTTGLWHETSTETAWGNLTQPDSFSFDDMCAATGSDYTYALRGAVAFSRMEPDNPTGDGALLTRYRISQHASGEDRYLFHDRVRLDVEANSALSYDSNVNADIYLLSSDDDGKTWHQYPKKSLSNIAYGTISGDKRYEWFRLGRSDDRIYKIFTNANTQVYLTGGFADITGGTR